MQGAWKVGLLVVVFIALGVGGYAFLGRSFFAPKTQLYIVQFDDAGGVAEGAAVLLAGVPVGQVARVELDPQRQAKVTLAIREEVELPPGTTAILPSALIGIGDRQVLLEVPSGAVGKLEPGSIIPGTKQTPLQSFLPDSEKTLEELNKTLIATQELLGDAGLKQRLAELMKTGEETAKSFGDLARRIDQTVVQNQATLRNVLLQGASVVSDVRVVSQEIARLAQSGKLEDQFDSVVANLNKTMESGQKLVADMNALIADPELKKNFQAILDNAKTMTESGTKIAADAEKMAANGVTITDKAVEVSAKVDQLAAKANELADSAKELLDKLKGAVDKLPLPGTDPLKLPRITTSGDLFRETNPGRWRTDVGLEIGLNSKETIHLGLWDAFESNKINLQLAQKLGPGQVRYGVFASKPGAGVDFPLAPNLGLRGDVFGLNDPRFDLKLRYQFRSGITGWLGVDRVFDRNSISVGVGIRK